MGLIQLILLILALWLAMKVVGHASRRLPRQTPRVRGGFTAMARCAHCGIHIPEHEAVRRAGQAYCCPEHRDLAGK